MISAGSKVERDKMTIMDEDPEPVVLSKWQLAIRDKLEKLAKNTSARHTAQHNLMKPESGFEGLYEQLIKHRYSDDFFNGLTKHGKLFFPKPSQKFHNYRGNKF